MLEARYRRHIAVEDHELFPLAATSLAPAQLADVGREMAARRGVDRDRARRINT